MRLRAWLIFLTKRLGFSLGVLLFSSVLIYGAMDIMPGGALTALSGGRPLTSEAETTLISQYRLDDPFVERYLHFLSGFLQGDLGVSYVAQGQPIATLLKNRMVTTLLLVGMSACLIVVAGVSIGTLVAFRRGVMGAALRTVALVGLATPQFVAATALISLFAVTLGWFPVFGSGEGLPDKVLHLVLPSIALALAGVGFVARLTEASVAEELSSEHVTTARARGLPARRVTRRHVLRNAATPISTAAGITIAYLFVGAAVVEQAFALDGVGSYLVDSLLHNDFPVVQAISLMIVAVFLITNLIVDIISSLLDPRIVLT